MCALVLRVAAQTTNAPPAAPDGNAFDQPRLKLPVADTTNDELVVKHPRFLLPYHDESRRMKYLEWLWKDPINLFTRPVFWSDDEWRTAAIEGGITGALMPADDAVRDIFQDNRSKSFKDGLGVINDFYGTYELEFAGAGLFVVGLVAGNEKLADSGFLGAESVAYAGMLCSGVKYVFGRERPGTASDQWQFHGFSPKDHSFVSGDTIVAFAFSSSVSEVWQTPWVTWPMYGLAVGVGLSRLERNAHWLSDVVGAAFLGHAIGKSIVHFHYGRNTEGKLVPFVTPDAVGLQVTFRF
jgi:hypothetical protein